MEYPKRINIRNKAAKLLGLKRLGVYELQKIVDIDLVHGAEANVNFIDEEGEKKSLKFYEDDMINRAEAYDEPWTFQWVSDNVPLSSSEAEQLNGTRDEGSTHKHYTFDVEYFGHPDTHLEMADMNTGDFNIEYTSNIT